MKGTSWLISRYLLTNILPYFFASWLVLSVILFIQQASRYADIFFGLNVPSALVWQLAVALIPSVVAFTCPMAILVGTMIGLAKMQGDSELVAIRASGVGNLQVTIPIIFLGLLLSAFAFFINLRGVPFAAGLVRQVALESAIKKFESPIEPGVFDSTVAGYTIYVRGGDADTGRWRNIFIYSEDHSSGSMRLVTSNDGRLDTAGQASELVLQNASVATLPLAAGAGKYASENIGEVRLAVRTKRSELIDKMTHADVSTDEMGLTDLARFAARSEGRDRTEAYILLERRLLLSVTPLIFCLLGTATVLRFGRGGRGFGILAALLVLIGFYLLAFLGEQLARVGAISIYAAGAPPVAGSMLLLLWLWFARRIDLEWRGTDGLRSTAGRLTAAAGRIRIGNIFVGLTTGLRDFDIIRNLVKNFALALSFLVSIFLIFTAFDLWKFAGTFEGGTLLLVKYLFYLLPYVYVQTAPSAVMISVLATYVVKSRQNEIVTWTSSGQSVYRLLMPCFIMAFGLGAFNWGLQEGLLPRANQLQDQTRSTIRNTGVPETGGGRYWVVSGARIISFELGQGLTAGQGLSASGVASKTDRTPPTDDTSNRDASRRISAVGGPFVAAAMPSIMSAAAAEGVPVIFASDNETGHGPVLPLTNVRVFDFTSDRTKLQTVYRGQSASWSNGQLIFTGSVEKDDLTEERISTSNSEGLALAEAIDPAEQLQVQPTHLTSSSIKRVRRISTSASETENLSIALERRYATPFLPFVVALFISPFALSLSRKGKAATVGYAVALWLLFTGVSSVGEQLGNNAMLSPQLSVWAPIVIFSLLGAYMLSKVRT